MQWINGRWTQADCLASHDQINTYTGTYVLGAEADCTSGYDGVCVQLDLLDDTDPAEYTIFSINPDLNPDVLYLPQGDTNPGNRPADVDTADTKTTLMRQP